MDINTLRTLRAKAVADASAIADKAKAENRSLTADEQKSFDAHMTAADNAKADITRAEKLENEKRELETAAPKKAPAVEPGKRSIIEVPHYRASKLRSFRGANAIEDAYVSGRWAAAALFGHGDSRKWCEEHGVRIARDPEARAMSGGVNTAGGFIVPDQFENAIIDLREEYGTFRQFARVMPMAGDTMTMPRRTGGVTAYFVGENTEVTASDKSWDNVTLIARKLGALCKYSSELAEDAFISVADDLSREIAYAFAVKEDACGWNGDGTSTYGGITGVRTAIIDGTHTASAIDAASGHDALNELDGDDLEKVMAACPKYALRNAKWYCSQAAYSVVFAPLLRAAGGITMNEMAGPLRLSYLGYPIVIDQTLPSAPSTDISDTAMLFFGDLSLAATFGTRRGITLMSSSERFMELDQIAIMGTERFAITVHDLGTASVAGPLIGMIGE
jgi:HK97 family phage major capsid protein